MRRTLALAALASLAGLAIWLALGERGGGTSRALPDAETERARLAAARLEEPGLTPAEPPAEEERVAADAAPEAEAEKALVAERLGEEATLVLRVRSRQTGEPIAGARAVIEPVGIEYRWHFRPIPGARARLNECPRAGDDGRLQFGVPADQAYSLNVNAGGFLPQPSGDGLHVPGLSHGEVREMTVELDTRYALNFHGRVVSLVDGSPIADARVRLADRRVTAGSRGRSLGKHTYFELLTEADGSFDCWTPPNLRGFAEAEGYARVDFNTSPEHGTPSAPLVIALPRVAEIGDVLVHGRMTDEWGEGVAHHEVWLQRAESDEPRYFGALLPPLRTSTDRKGRFAFPEVEGGVWWIGPGVDLDAPGARAIAPYAEVVRIDAKAGNRRIDLTVHRGLYIRCRLGPAGLGGEVVVEGVGLRSGAVVRGSGWSGSELVLGPLRDEAYRLHATCRRRGRREGARSKDVLARPGPGVVELLLTRAATLNGSTIGAESGAPLSAVVTLLHSEGRSVLTDAFLSKRGGRFFASDILPGTYTVLARTDSGQFGRADVLVETGRRNSVRVELFAGARVTLSLDEDIEGASFEIWRGQTSLARGRIATGQHVLRTVPAGELSVRLVSMDGEVLSERAVTCVVGELHAVRLAVPAKGG